MKLRVLILSVLSLGLLAIASLTLADPNDVAVEPAPKSAADIHGSSHHQHGGKDGHLPATSSNVALVGKGRVKLDVGNRLGDVGVLGDYAYVAAFNEPNCNRGGVYVFDIANPAAPRQVSFIPTGNNSYVGEGVQVVHIDTPAYSGDVLTMNNEVCQKGLRGTVGGLTLVDVSNPKQPVKLVEGFGDLTPAGWAGPGKAHQIHSVFVWDAGDKAYAVVVDDEENADVDILDITDPRRPQLIAEHDLARMFPHIEQPELPLDDVLHHDVIVEKVGDRFVMLVSYWDAGYVKLDVTDPLNPVYLADSDYAFPDPLLQERTGLARRAEGNGHQAEFSSNNDYIVAADEDFAPYSVQGLNVPDGIDFPAHPAWGGNPIPPPGTVYEGDAVFVGRACPGDPAVPPGNGAQIAVLERGSCQLFGKLDAVNAAGGYKATVVVNGTAAGLPGGTSCDRVLTLWFQIRDYPMTWPAFGITPRQVGYDLFGAPYDNTACRTSPTDERIPVQVGTVGKQVRLKYGFDGWGYVRLFSNNNGKLTELDTWAIAEGHDQSVADGHGDLTVHEVAMSNRANDLAYLSYYAGGLRVARIVNGKLQETGRFIDQGGSNFWGVQVWEKNGKEYVLASDRNFGLYIFEYTGPGKVNP
ncbi:MAG TPA: hypothetical protein VHJ78_12160 [Actinomycetota bacterium]|nr:hypothetical protein [Actinomycetota bacterium]